MAYLVTCGMGVQRFLMVVDRTPVAPPPTKYLTTHALKERGWTATMIAALLPRPDATRTAYVRLPGQALLKRCVQSFRPNYKWPERWCQRSDWQLSLVDVQAFYDRWAPKFTDMSYAARQRVLDALHEKNRRLFSKRFLGVTPGPQRPPKLKRT